MDIDDALDQLEKKLSSPPQYPVNHDLSTTNTDIIFDQLQQADVSTNSINENKYSPSYTVDELLLLDSNDDNDKTNNDNKLEKLKQDILKLYAVNTILPTPISTADEHLTSDLPDVITQSSADVNDAIVEQEDINTLNNNHHDNDDIVSILDVVQNSDQILDNIQSHNERIDLLPDLTNIESKTIENDQQQSVLDHIVEQQEIHVENELTDQRVEIEDEPDLLLQTIDDSNESNILFTNQVKYNIDDTNNNQQNEDFLLPSNETEVSLINDFFSTVPDVVNQQYKDDVDLVCSQHEDILYNSNNNENMILQEFDLVKNTISDDDQMPIELENNNNNNSNYNYDNSNNSMQIPPPQYELEQIVKSDTIEKPHDIEEQVKSSNEDGFHFLEELLATLPPSSSTVTTAEEPFYHFSSEQVDKIDMLLKQIVDDHQHQELSPQAQSNELTHEEICTMDLEHRYNNNDINNIAEQVDNSCTSATISFQSDDKQNQSEITQENELSESTTDQDLHEKLLQAESEWSSLSENDRTLGQVCPQWMNDQEAAACMKCTTRFTLTRRRHHCRACGKIFCSACCSQKAKLIHLDNREDRACNDCVQTINKVEQLFTFLRQNQKPRSSVLRKRTGSNRSDLKKSVTFEDGIKPGSNDGDASGTSTASATTLSKYNGLHYLRKSKTSPTATTTANVAIKQFMPAQLSFDETEERLHKLQDPNELPLTIRINSNLIVLIKIINLSCCVNRLCWVYSTRGLCTVSQDEIIYIIECEKIEIDNEQQHRSTIRDIINEILLHINQIYNEAMKGIFIRPWGISSCVDGEFLGSKDNCGFLYIQRNNQCIENLFLPEPPYLFGILLNRWELPWANVFPLRVMFRFGLQYQYYPWPLFGVANREPVYGEVGHTILSLLCDFRSYSYTLPTVRGLTITIKEHGSVSVRIPRNRYEEIVKGLNQSLAHVLSFGGCLNQIVQQHLVAVQNPDDQQYSTQVIKTDPTLKKNPLSSSTGSSFIVINASLRSLSPTSSPPTGYSPVSGSLGVGGGSYGKSSTIEDGVMVQVDLETLKLLKQALKDMKDYTIISNKSVVLPQQLMEHNENVNFNSDPIEQLVEFIWIENDRDINLGIRSPIDYFPMDRIQNSRIHYSLTHQHANNTHHNLRWTDIYFIDCDNFMRRLQTTTEHSLDPTKLADTIAKGFIQALTPVSDQLKEANCYKIGLRATIDRENAFYLSGSNGEQLSQFFLSQLDDVLVPIIMNAAEHIGQLSLVLELIFYLIE